jgi:hypothetical protein
MTTLFNERRFGRFSFSHHILSESPGIVQKVFRKAIPVDIKYDIMNDSYDVRAFSAEFEPISLGQIPPEYNVIIHTRNRKTGTVDPITLIPRFRKEITIKFVKK